MIGNAGTANGWLSSGLVFPEGVLRESQQAQLASTVPNCAYGGVVFLNHEDLVVLLASPAWTTAVSH